ncbi:hypothetical protein GCM10010282_55180 [Streptomyces roseolus]|nr:hypothetical protein GCM10010282_55180 [Streptomyces roseolus]
MAPPRMTISASAPPGGQHHLKRQDFAAAARRSDAPQAGHGEEECVTLAGVEFRQTGVDVVPDGPGIQAGWDRASCAIRRTDDGSLG